MCHLYRKLMHWWTKAKLYTYENGEDEQLFKNKDVAIALGLNSLI